MTTKNKKTDGVVVEKPEIFWHSDPVKADETVMVQGHGFTDDCAAELCCLDDNDDGAPSTFRWDNQSSTKVKPIVRSAGNLMCVLPAEWPQSIIACKIGNHAGSSKTVLINAPDPWWLQGDLGLDGAPGGWLRILGKCLNFGGKSRVLLRAEKSGREITLPAMDAACYSLKAELPKTISEGKYEILVHNGLGGGCAWKTAGKFIIRQPVQWKQDVFDVTAFGAHPNKDEEDSTPAIVAAIQQAEANGGGIVYFPGGRYRVTEMLNVPPFVTLKGEGMGLVSLFWPDRPVPLPSLILGKQSFAVEDLTLYTHGTHYNVITGEDNTRINRVRIRAYWLFELGERGKEHRGRRVDKDCHGAGLFLTGKNIVVADCDILHSFSCLMLHRVEGGLVVRNKFQIGNYFYSYCNRSLIFEHNESIGAGGSIAMGCCSWAKNLYDSHTCKHIYYAGNKMTSHYHYDREILTTDNQGTGYFGGVKEAHDRRVVLASDPFWREEGRAALADWKASTLYNLKYKDDSDPWQIVILEDPAEAPRTGATLYILGGKGAGQYRRLTNCEGRNLEIEYPWDIDPDNTSVVSIAKYNGRHIIVGNVFEDAGIIQLFPPNYECILAENRVRRCGSFVSGGQLTDDKEGFGGVSAAASWRNQFLDNVIEEGNGWGQGGSGSGVGMLIYASNREPDYQLPISRCQIVRRQIGENNSSMRISGCVEGALVENCIVRKNPSGVEIKMEGPRKGEKESIVNAPVNVLLRHNRFEDVQNPYVGNAMEKVVVQD